MKHKRIVIALVLLASLLLSSCGQAFPRMTQTALLYAEAAPKAFSEPAAKAEEEKAPAPETAAEAPALLSAFREAPAGVQTAQPMAPAGGKVEPIRVTTDMFRAKFEGSAVSGSGEAVGGVYRFAATQTDGEAWHVKLECNYPTVAGRDYRISYRFHSDVAGKVKFGDFQEFEIREGDNSLTGILTASSGTSYLDLQLGMLPPFTIDFSEIEVEEYADEGAGNVLRLSLKLEDDIRSGAIDLEKELYDYYHDLPEAAIKILGDSLNDLVTVQEAADALVELACTIEPDPEITARYEERYQKFRKIYPALRELFPEIQ